MHKCLLLTYTVITLLLAGCGSSPQEDFERRVGQAMRSPASDPTFTSPMGSLQRAAMSAPTGSDSESITPDQLFDWAETTYPQFFPSREKTLTWSVYQFRYYKDTDVYFAVENGNKVVVIGKPTNGALIGLGSLSHFIDSVGRQNVFSETPATLKHPKDYFPNFCPAGGDTLGPRWGIADLNADGIKDFVTAYWCPAIIDKHTQAPTKNTLVTYISQSDGTYRFGNLELFGQSIVNIGGMPYRFIVGDFNRDGKPDVGISITWEDGRWQNGDFSAWEAPQTVLLSSANKSYSVETLSKRAASGKIQAVDNEMGGIDLVYPINPFSPPAAYRWFGSSQVEVGGYPPVNVLMTFFPRNQNGRGSDLLISQSPDPADGPASIQVSRRVGQQWQSFSKYIIPSKLVRSIIWNGEMKDDSVVLIGKAAMSYGVFEDSCLINDFRLDAQLVLVRVTGFLLPEDWERLSVVDQRYLNSVSMLLGFEIKDGVITRRIDLDIPLQDRFFNEYSCIDLDGNGYDDVIIHANGSNPRGNQSEAIFFTRQSGGGFSRVTLQNLPKPPQSAIGWPDSFNYVTDLNADGRLDLIFYTSQIESKFNSLPYIATIHFGIRSIKYQ